jgi:hypothetical protein
MNDSTPPFETRLLIPELDPYHETHAYLRSYKEARLGHWQASVTPLSELSELQVFLLCLDRRTEVLAITLAVRPLIADHDDWQTKEGHARSWAREIFRAELLSLGAYAAKLDQKDEVVQDLLRGWGPKIFGWRARSKPADIEKNYKIAGSSKDPLLKHLDNLHGEEASKRLHFLCRQWMWLLTDHLIVTHRLAGVELLERVGVTQSMILSRAAVCEPIIKQLLELKRLEQIS